VPTAKKPKAVDGQARQIDVMPTILDLVGVDLPADVDGSSLTPAMDGYDMDLTAYSEVEYPPNRHYVAVRRGGWKYIYNAKSGAGSLFDLRSDPDEMKPVENESIRKERTRADAVRYLGGNMQRKLTERGRAELDNDTRDRLRALGYIG
jgi:arylsulfatase A-like enzyme